MNEVIKNWRETMYQLNTSQHNFPQLSDSVLADLPISKPRNSYSKIAQGRAVLLDGEDGTHRAQHKFCFRFFPLETNHVNKIHSIMLEQSTNIWAIVFKSYSGARKVFEHYLSLPADRGYGGFKFVLSTPDDPRKIFLGKLETAARQMGSDVTATYVTQRFEINEEREAEELGVILEKNLPKEPTELMQLYIKLGEQICREYDQYISNNMQAEVGGPCLKILSKVAEC
jgi:hypothetical protein